MLGWVVVPQGEGERMVMDLQDVGATMEDQVKNSEIRLFASSGQGLAVGPTASSSAVTLDDDLGLEDEDDEDADDAGNEDDDEDMEDIGDEEEDEADYEDVDEDADQGRTSLRQGRRYVQQSNDASKDVDFADSDSELGFGDDGELGHTVDKPIHIGKDDDDDMDGDEEEDDDEHVPRWKTNLADNARLAFETSGGKKKKKDWMKLIYTTSLTPEQILADDTSANKTGDADSQDDEDEDDGDFFKIKEGGARNEFAEGGEVDEDRTKLVYDPAELKKWEDEELLDSIRHLFITGGSGEGDENGYDGENGYEDLEGGGDFEDMEVDEDGAGGGSAAQDPETSKRATLAAKKAELKRKFDEQYDDPEASKLDFYEEAKDAMAKQAALNAAEFTDVDAETRALVEGHRPGTYVRIELTSSNTSTPLTRSSSVVSYLRRNVWVSSRSVSSGTAGTRRHSRRTTRSCSRSAGGGSRPCQSTHWTTTASGCACSSTPRSTCTVMRRRMHPSPHPTRGSVRLASSGRMHRALGSRRLGWCWM
jgi:ribosome biogenesis protein BMS1